MTIDPTMGDPVVARLHTATEARDWRTVAELISATEHPDDHFRNVREAAFTPDVHEWIDDWVAAESRSALPLLIKGAHAISWASEARGGGRAHTVSEAAFKVFFKRLKIAEDCLDEVTDRDPDSATAWAFLVILGRARQVGLDETRRRFDEVRRRHPWHVEAHEAMLQQLCAKWGGSHELMHGFAGETVAAMPAGSLLGQLVPAAHIEQWLDMPIGEDEEYVTSTEVRAGLNAAADRSVRHPAFVRRAHWPTVHNSFAMAFTLNEDWPSAREQFDVIGDLMTNWPWQYMPDQEGAFIHSRDQAYAETGADSQRIR